MKKENWKYVVLGIGIGLLLAATVLLRFGEKEKESLSEREIIEKARELGMIFLTEINGDENATKKIPLKEKEPETTAPEKESGKEDDKPKDNGENPQPKNKEEIKPTTEQKDKESKPSEDEVDGEVESEAEPLDPNVPPQPTPKVIDRESYF